jgi:hypothetical protein
LLVVVVTLLLLVVITEAVAVLEVSATLIIMKPLVEVVHLKLL